MLRRKFFSVGLSPGAAPAASGRASIAAIAAAVPPAAALSLMEADARTESLAPVLARLGWKGVFGLAVDALRTNTTAGVAATANAIVGIGKASFARGNWV